MEIVLIEHFKELKKRRFTGDEIIIHDLKDRLAGSITDSFCSRHWGF